MTIQQAAKDMEVKMNAELENVGDPLPTSKPKKKVHTTRKCRKARLVVENAIKGDGSTIELASFNLKGDANLAAQAMADYTKRPHGVLHKGSLTWFAPGA